jgi:hypothetical protein
MVIPTMIAMIPGQAVGVGLAEYNVILTVI